MFYDHRLDNDPICLWFWGLLGKHCHLILKGERGGVFFRVKYDEDIGGAVREDIFAILDLCRRSTRIEQGQNMVRLCCSLHSTTRGIRYVEKERQRQLFQIWIELWLWDWTYFAMIYKTSFALLQCFLFLWGNDEIYSNWRKSLITFLRH